MEPTHKHALTYRPLTRRSALELQRGLLDVPRKSFQNFSSNSIVSITTTVLAPFTKHIAFGFMKNLPILQSHFCASCKLWLVALLHNYSDLAFGAVANTKKVHITQWYSTVYICVEACPSLRTSIVDHDSH